MFKTIHRWLWLMHNMRLIFSHTLTDFEKHYKKLIKNIKIATVWYLSRAVIMYEYDLRFGGLVCAVVWRSWSLSTPPGFQPPFLTHYFHPVCVHLLVRTFSVFDQGWTSINSTFMVHQCNLISNGFQIHQPIIYIIN